MKNWKAIIGIIGIFMLGMMAGGILTAKIIQKKVREVILGGPEAVANMIVPQMSRQLGLEAKQREQLRVIVLDTQKEMKAVRKQAQPQIMEVLDRAEGKIRIILKPEQLKAFDQLVVQGKAKWGQIESK